MGPIADSFSPVPKDDIIEILQTEQNRAMELLSSSPMLAGLFFSYAKQATALKSVTPSTETEEWKALQNTISTLQGKVDKLESENLKMTGSLGVATASLGVFGSRVTSLENEKVAQQKEISSLKGEHSQFVEDSKVEKDALASTISGLEVCLGL